MPNTTPDSYSLPTITAAWTEYKSRRAWRCKKNGRTTVKLVCPDMAEGWTSVDVVKVKDVLDFPTYLEKVFA
jgi:hypothetical protein